MIHAPLQLLRIDLLSWCSHYCFSPIQINVTKNSLTPFYEKGISAIIAIVYVGNIPH